MKYHLLSIKLFGIENSSLTEEKCAPTRLLEVHSGAIAAACAADLAFWAQQFFSAAPL